MFIDNPFVESVDNWVTVWVGSLKEEELEKYLDEPGGAFDNEPISDFSEDLGRWYDHDHIWMEGVSTPLPPRELCERNGIDSEELIQEIEKRTGAREISSLLMLWNARVICSRQRVFAKGSLKCLGSWEHESPLTDF